MTRKQTNTIALVALGLLLLFPVAISNGDYRAVLQNFIPLVEGYSPTPIWDYSQWSWGYGTAAGYDPNKKPAGTISRERAWQEALQVINSHASQLIPTVKANLNKNQAAALLSFSYNCGTGNAKNIVQTINSGTVADVVARMKKYVYAGGKYNQGLANRRQKETDLYQGITSYGRMMEVEPDPANWIPAEMIGDREY